MQEAVTFGKYLLMSKIATGGMAEIFLARPAAAEANGRILVIKKILPHVAADSSFLKMFKAEIQICMGFSHPNTVQFHDFGQIGKQMYIAMEFIEGKNLKQLIGKCADNGHKVPIAMATSIAAQAAAGLQYAHTFHNAVTGDDLRIIHRDISPQNLILSYDGNVKIIDFGIAKAAIELADRTQTGLLKGKAGYIAPEQIAGLPADPRSDLFSIGVVLWEMLTGQRLFSSPGDTELTILARIQKCDEFITPPSQRNSLVPKELDAIVIRCLAKDPDKRFQTAAELQKALRDFLAAYQPGYSYSDVGNALKQLFQSEMLEERQKLKALNQRAQDILMSTMVLDTNSGQNRDEQEMAAEYSHDPSGGFWIKAMARIKQENRKATMRHYVLLALYVLTVIGLKVDPGLSFLDRIARPKTIVEFASSEPPAATTMRLVRKPAQPPAVMQVPGNRISK